MSQITLEKNTLGSMRQTREEKPIAESNNKCTICDWAERTRNVHSTVITHLFNSHIKPGLP